MTRLLYALLLLATTATAAPRPNIIIYLADDMGMGDTSAYQDWSANPDNVQLHTPELERLARRGIRFTGAHSPHSRCTTTRYALLTGRYCWRTPLKHWVLFGVQGDPLIESNRPTIATFLGGHGYRTGMVGKWHVGLTYTRSDGTPADAWHDADLRKPIADGPLDHGFDFFHGISRSHPTSGPYGQKRNTPDQSIGPGWIHNRTITGATDNGKQLDGSYDLYKIAPTLHQNAHTFLKDNTKPFLLYFASPANHTPHTPCDDIDGRPVRGASKFKNGTQTKSDRLDFIYENDVQVGLLLDHLENTDDPRNPGHNLIDNTLFIFASDNGAESSAKTATGPLRSNKGSTFEGGHRIPFIASWPAGKIGDADDETPGQTSSHLLGLNDLFATVAAIIEKPLPDLAAGQIGAEDSHSQLPALRNLPDAKPRPPLFSNDHKQASKKKSDKRAVVAVHSHATPLPGAWKLFLDHTFANHQKLNPIALYNLTQDPEEQTDLLADPTSKPTLEFLLNSARNAAGDNGHSRR